MVITHLRWFCLTLFLIASVNLAFSYNKAPYPEFDFGGNGATISNQRHNPTINNNGISNSTNARASFPKHRVSTPIKATSTWGRNAINKGVRGALKVGKSSAATLLVSTGILMFIDEMGWFIDDDTLMYNDSDEVPSVGHGWCNVGSGQCFSTLSELIDMLPICKMQYQDCRVVFDSGSTTYGNVINYGPSSGGWGFEFRTECPSGSILTNKGCVIPSPKPVTDPMIDGSDTAKYRPHPADLPYISPHIGRPNTITVDPIPTIPGRTETETKPDGTTTETEREYSVSTKTDPKTGTITFTPTEKTTETDYKDGIQTDQRTRTKTETPAPTEAETEEAIRQETQPKAEPVPTDCDFMPTVCKFIDWVKAPPEAEEPQLPKVEDRDFKRDFPINIGNGQCPQPYQMNTIIAGNLSLSFQPFCDLASALRYLVIAGASIFAAYILLGVVRRG